MDVSSSDLAPLGQHHRASPSLVISSPGDLSRLANLHKGIIPACARLVTRLAEDLGRFLKGEPIRARPPMTWERAMKWAKLAPEEVGQGQAEAGQEVSAIQLLSRAQ